jgi:hypothetical protein
MDQYDWKLEFPNSFHWNSINVIFEGDLSGSLGADTKSLMDRHDLREYLKTVIFLTLSERSV